MSDERDHYSEGNRGFLISSWSSSLELEGKTSSSILGWLRIFFTIDNSRFCLFSISTRVRVSSADFCRLLMTAVLPRVFQP